MRVSQLVSGLSVEEQQPIEEQLKLWDDSSIWEILWKKGAGGIVGQFVHDVAMFKAKVRAGQITRGA